MLEDLLNQFAKESDKLVEDKLLTLMDLYNEQPVKYGRILDNVWKQYEQEHSNARMYDYMRGLYTGLREL